METPIKPKRTLSPEALQKLKLAREKALEAKRKDKEISKYEKEQKRQEKNKKRDDTYQAVVKLTQSTEQPKEQPKQQPKQQPPKPKRELVKPPEPEPEPEEEEEEEEEEERPPPRKIVHKKPIPAPKTIRRKVKITDDDLYANANIEMLRHKLYEQTRKRLTSELFNY